MHTYIRYYDDYERGEDGAWRFANRTLKFAYALPLQQCAESLTGATDRCAGPAPSRARRTSSERSERR